MHCNGIWSLRWMCLTFSDSQESCLCLNRGTVKFYSLFILQLVHYVVEKGAGKRDESGFLALSFVSLPWHVYELVKFFQQENHFSHGTRLSWKGSSFTPSWGKAAEASASRSLEGMNQMSSFRSRVWCLMALQLWMAKWKQVAFFRKGGGVKRERERVHTALCFCASRHLENHLAL